MSQPEYQLQPFGLTVRTALISCRASETFMREMQVVGVCGLSYGAASHSAGTSLTSTLAGKY